MKGKYALGGITLLFLAYAIQPLYAEGQPIAFKAPEKGIQIQITGQARVESGEKSEYIYFTELDGKSFQLLGPLSEDLKTKLNKLGEKNLFSLKVTPDGKSSIACEKSQTYKFNDKKERTLDIEAKCIRYYHVNIDEIISAQQSDKTAVEPARDVNEEIRMLAKPSATDNSPIPFTTGEIYGKISKVDLNAPFKSVLITNRDQSDPLKQVSIIITQNTRIVKKIGMAEPLNVLTNSLSVGQEVTAVYARDDLKSEAIFITITKE